MIADEHRLFRAGLRRLFESESDLQIVGEAADGDEAVDAVRTLNPDVLLLDLCLPRRTGLDVLRVLAESDSPVPHRVVLTGAIADGQLIEALQLGAQGIVPKDCATPVLFNGIRAVVNGGCWVGRERVTNPVHCLQLARAAAADATRRTSFGLTARELQVVSALAAGYTNREIAQRLAMSEDTVKHHLTSIFDKCGVFNRVELAMFAVRHHIVDTA